jgi:hypothetical protein
VRHAGRPNARRRIELARRRCVAAARQVDGVLLACATRPALEERGAAELRTRARRLVHDADVGQQALLRHRVARNAAADLLAAGATLLVQRARDHWRRTARAVGRTRAGGVAIAGMVDCVLVAPRAVDSVPASEQRLARNVVALGAVGVDIASLTKRVGGRHVRQRVARLATRYRAARLQRITPGLPVHRSNALPHTPVCRHTPLRSL